MVRDRTTRPPRRSGDEAVRLAPLIDWLERDLDGITETVHGAIVKDLPVLAEDDDPGTPDLKSSIESHMPVIAASIREGSTAKEVAVPGAADSYTRHLAQRGVPLDQLLRSYEVGTAAMWTAFASTLRTGPTRQAAARRAEVLELASLRIFDYLQTATAWAVTTYTRERLRLERRAASRRAESVAAVLDGTLDGHEAEHRLGGYPLTLGHMGYVAWTWGDPDADLLDRFDTGLPTRIGARQHVSITGSDGSVHGWFTVNGRRVVDAAGAVEPPLGVGFALGGVHRGVAGFRMTHIEALEARRVAELLGRGGAADYETLAVAALASREMSLARAFVERELGGLLAADGPTGRLMTTLQLYLDELGSPTRTARRLGVHTNTVVKRLERIEQLLGRRFEPARLQLRVAIELAPLVHADPAASAPRR